MTMFGSKGMINAGLVGFGIVDVPLDMMFTEGAVIVGIIAVNLPFMVLTLQSVIESLDRSVAEAAFNMVAGPWRVSWRVLWPGSEGRGVVDGCVGTCRCRGERDP